MITKAVTDAARDAFDSESRKWMVTRHYGDNSWALTKTAEALDLSAAGAAVDAGENIETFRTQELAELSKRDKIITAVLAAVDRAYMGVKSDA